MINTKLIIISVDVKFNLIKKCLAYANIIIIYITSCC